MGKGKWEVYSNQIGGNKYYIVGRQVDDTKPAEMLNVEFRGRYMGDKSACKMVADEMNASPPSAELWIPVDEKLPPVGEMVAVTCVTKKGIRNWNRAFVDATGFWHGSGSMSGVVAWMPMAVYKG